MLYRALVRFMSLVARTFYKRIEVVGLANVPADGAVILAGNHPNALIDGVLLMCHAGRTPVHFLGNAKLWKIPLLARLLDALGAVPVQRREEHGPGADNRDAFDRVDEVLARGGCVAIFRRASATRTASSRGSRPARRGWPCVPQHAGSPRSR